MSRVMVVDDSLSVRKAVERALRARSLEVLSVASGAEAIERIEREEPDLVICDVIMPDRDGYQICDFVKTHPRLGRIPVLLISGIVNNTVLDRAAKVKSNAVMGKPFTAEELLRKIDTLLLPLPAAPPEPVAEAVVPVPDRVAPVEPSAIEAAVPELPPAPSDIKRILSQFAAMAGVRLAALVDREGFLIESAGVSGVDAEVAAALASCLAESSDGIGSELGQGAIHGIILEYTSGTVLLQSVGTLALLAIVLDAAAVLGKVRYYVKKALPELTGAL